MRKRFHEILLALFFAAFVFITFFSSRWGNVEYLLAMSALAVFGMRLNKAMTRPPP